MIPTFSLLVRSLMLMLMWCCLQAVICATDGSWTIDLPIAHGGERTFALGDGRLLDDHELVFAYQRSQTTAAHDVWLEFCLLSVVASYLRPPIRSPLRDQGQGQCLNWSQT